ncbi:MAG: cytochrome C [Bacteroidota bacterium]
MKKLYKIALILIIIIVVIITSGLLFVNLAYPSVAPPRQLTVKATPEMIARGDYLVHHVAVCMDCHSTRNWKYYSGPITEGTLGKGGDLFDQSAGVPGKVYAKNITPANLSSWTDGELYRTITTGVDKKGEPIFPIMPYSSYAKMDPEDVMAIIAFLRTLKPIPNNVPAHNLDFPMNLIVRSIPQEATPTKRPPESDTIAYGKYITTIAACADCHTPQDKGTPLPGMNLAGGFEFKLPMGIVRTANITPDNETGIGLWTEDMFIQRFKMYDNPDARKISVKPGDFNTIMPFTMYAGMKTEDLRAMYKYLRTVKPVRHSVVKFTPQ